MDQVTPEDRLFVETTLDSLRQRFPELVDEYLRRLYDDVAAHIFGSAYAAEHGTDNMRRAGTLNATIIDWAALDKLFGFTNGLRPPAGFELTELEDRFYLRCEACSFVSHMWFPATSGTPTQDDLENAARDHTCTR